MFQAKKALLTASLMLIAAMPLAAAHADDRGRDFDRHDFGGRGFDRDDGHGFGGFFDHDRDHDFDRGGGRGHGAAPLPLLGAGIPTLIAVAGGGVLLRRRFGAGKAEQSVEG